jgi:hypothetical protein
VNAWNTEPTVPSTEKNKFIDKTVEVQLTNASYTIRLYDTALAQRWFASLQDNLHNRRIIEKNFCFLGFATHKRNLDYLVKELNRYIRQINSFQFSKPYQYIHSFRSEDFQYSNSLGVGKDLPGLKLKHDSTNLLHRYFEDLQGTVWQLSPYYKEADYETKYAIRQLNLLCHEIEGCVWAHWNSVADPDWLRPSQITTFLNAPRHGLELEDYELFKQNRYDRDLGGVYLHWSQIGKTLYEVFRDEGGGDLDEATCSHITHQKFYSGEFDIEWGQSITEDLDDFKKNEMEPYRKWLKHNGYDWEDPKLALGYIKLGQVDLQKSFGSTKFQDVYNCLKDNLDIVKITAGDVHCDYNYSLDSEDWKKIQMQELTKGYNK